MSNQAERDRIATWVRENRRTITTLIDSLDVWKEWLEEWQTVDHTWQDHKLDSMDIRSLAIIQLGAVEEIEEDKENPRLSSMMNRVTAGITEINERISILDRLVGGLPIVLMGRSHRSRES